MTTDTDAQDRAITHALTQEIQDIATDMITRGVEDGYVCSDRSNSNLSLQLLVATDLEIDLLDKQPGVHWHLKLKGASLESKAVEFDGGECFRAAALDALSDLYAEVESHIVCARGALLYGAELVARNDAAGDDIMSAIDPSLQDDVERNTRRIKQLEDKVDMLTVKSFEGHVPPAPAPAPEVHPELVDTVTSDAATSASILNDAASLIEESRRRVFTAKGLAMTALEVQPEPVTPPTESEITQHQIDALLAGLDVLAARLIEHATPPRPDDHHFSAEVVPMCELKLGVYPRLGGKGFSVEWLLEIGYHTTLVAVVNVRPVRLDDTVKCCARRGWDALRDKIESHINATRMLLAFTPDTLAT